jgi:L-methionine (R)-S-oxide reductase
MQNIHEAVEQLAAHTIRDSPDLTVAMERLVELLKAHLPDYTWVGIYLLDGDELVLGPYRGKPSPHTRIPVDKGICGAAVAERSTIIVDDVDADPRYLACSVETRSEIVVPIQRSGRIYGELDIDSDRQAAFGPADRTLLEHLAALLAEKFERAYDLNLHHSLP